VARAQGIRPSQFITTYGPGALLEGVGGPRVVMSLDKSNLFQTLGVEQFEIVEPALHQILGGTSRFFRMPTNADLGRPETDAIYETNTFPKWSLCVRHGLIYRHSYTARKACPDCPAQASPREAHTRARLEAISLVMACPQGHLFDVDWLRLVHKKDSSCSADHLLWVSRGSSLRRVEIRCRLCQAHTNLGEHYLKEHLCKGFFAEGRDHETCPCKAKIVQRGAANLFTPESLSSITVPRVSTPLMRALSHTALINLLPLISAPAQLRQLAQTAQGLPHEFRELLASASDEELATAMEQAQQQSTELTPAQARQIEFRELQAAVQHGLKFQSPNSPAWAASEFEVDPALSRTIAFPPFQLRVTPILRLRVVTAQTGYRRLGGRLVSAAYAHANSSWYPAVELLGEGIFIDFAQTPTFEETASWRWWARHHGNTDLPHHKPSFVWWHTLAHRLVRALAIHSGYSSASVRERIYEEGMLLYAVQPGGDGTLGGLIAMVERFESILREAVGYLDNCSNDPFCAQAPRHPGEMLASGPACYACSLLSETSCEHRNSSLDRILLLESLQED
jgi:hypothetical protein